MKPRFFCLIDCDDDMMIVNNQESMFQLLMIQNIITNSWLNNGKIFSLFVVLNDNTLNIKRTIEKQENISTKIQILYFQNDESNKYNW